MLNRVAIVILNWNGKEHLERFLPSVIEHSKGARIIVADNASTDDSVLFLRENYPNIELIHNESNGGFAKGYNECLKHVDSEFYLLLNSDVEVSANYLDGLMEMMLDPKVAGAQPKVISYERRDEFEHAGATGGFLDKNYFPFCRGRIFDLTEKDKHQYDSKAEVFWTTGACMLIRSELFQKVGGFDEDFFAHMEEIDLCWRLKRRGYKFMSNPSSVVYHLGGGTLSYRSPRKTYLNFRNSLFMIAKNHQGWVIPKLFWRVCLDGLAANMFIIKGEFGQFWALFKAHMAFYGKFGRFMKKRKADKTPKEQFNSSGLFGASILWNRYAKGVKEYSKLNQRLFK